MSSRAAVSRAAVALAIAAACAAGSAHAHTGFKTTTLRALVLQSDVVARVRVVDPSGELLLRDPVIVREPVVVVEPLEVIKGKLGEGRLRFVQHGHGVPLYRQGEEAVVFLQRIERSRELGALAGHVEWVSIQEGEALALDDVLRAGFVAALRSYAALEALPAAAQPEALRRVTLELLSSPHRALAESAAIDVAMAGDASFVRAENVPAFERLIANDATPIGVRVTLLAELERRGLVEGPPRWARLLRQTRGSDRLVAVRATAAHPSAPVTQELVRLLASNDALLVSAAAIALGVPDNDAAVEPLARLLASGEERVRMAAIRGLGRMGTPAARAQLAQAATSHPDVATRRRARAEIARLGTPTPAATPTQP